MDSILLYCRLLGGKKVSAATFQREFQLSDVLDYVKTGVASIIEDEVTQRFEGEELRSWNLLTRTNHKFRFINWKLTFFWGFGCFFRYCVLLPGRIAIFIVGVSRLIDLLMPLILKYLQHLFQLLYMVLGMSIIGPVRDGPFKRWLNHQVTTSCFQVFLVSTRKIIFTFTCSGVGWGHLRCDHLSRGGKQT